MPTLNLQEVPNHYNRLLSDEQQPICGAARRSTNNGGILCSHRYDLLPPVWCPDLGYDIGAILIGQKLLNVVRVGQETISDIIVMPERFHVSSGQDYEAQERAVLMHIGYVPFF